MQVRDTPHPRAGGHSRDTGCVPGAVACAGAGATVSTRCARGAVTAHPSLLLAACPPSRGRSASSTSQSLACGSRSLWTLLCACAARHARACLAPHRT